MRIRNLQAEWFAGNFAGNYEDIYYRFFWILPVSFEVFGDILSLGWSTLLNMDGIAKQICPTLHLSLRSDAYLI